MNKNQITRKNIAVQKEGLRKLSLYEMQSVSGGSGDFWETIKNQANTLNKQLYLNAEKEGNDDKEGPTQCQWEMIGGHDGQLQLRCFKTPL